MRVLLCEDADWLMSEEAFSIYASCMYHPTYEDYKAQIHFSGVLLFNARILVIPGIASSSRFHFRLIEHQLNRVVKDFLYHNFQFGELK